MKKIKLICKKIIIIYIIIYILASSISSCFARTYDEECGKYLANYAKEFISQYGANSTYVLSTWPTWSGGSFGQGTLRVCCSSGVLLMYKEALGVDLTSMGISYSGDVQSVGASNQYFDVIPMSQVKPGDILARSGHMELAISDGANDHANFGSNDPACKIHNNASSYCTFTTAIRLKSSVQVNPTGSVPTPTTAGEENTSIYDSNGFIYSGVAKLQGYNSSMPFGKWIVKMLTEILDYLIGILTLIPRMVIVGWTAIIERFVVDGIVNAVTGITNKRDDSWEKDPDTIDEIDKEIMEQENENKTETTGSQATGDESNPNEYISEGMQGIADIGGKVQLKTASEANVTVENIVYNKIPILDINFFNFESAGGAVVDKDGIIYIIKENVAMWYYIFRTLAIIIMLLVLIYLGIKMAISTVAEKKAVYKEMLLSWVIGFVLVFAINYVMYAIIAANETFINWIIPKYESGQEISLYETVRSKAYEIKASTGFTGMWMYMVLVYYAIRFLIVYFKRYLTIMILALMSPFIAVMYAIQKINKKGKGGEIYGNWAKDFMYTVWIQSIHALIYTIFIQMILDLTQISLVGILMAFMFLHFMIKVDPIMRKIFGFTAGKNAAKLSVAPIASQLAVVKQVGKEAKKIGGVYGNVLGKTVIQPGAKLAGKIGDRIDKFNDKMVEKYGIEETETKEARDKRKKEQAEQNKKMKKTIEGIGTGLKISKDMALTGIKFAAVVPALIVEPKLAATVLESTVTSADKVKKTIESARKKGLWPKKTPSTTRYRLKAIQPKNSASAKNIKSRLNRFGVNYEEETRGTTKEGKQPNKKKLTEKQRRALKTKLGIKNLKLASTNKTTEELMEEALNGKVDNTEEYLDILVAARRQEEEIETMYKELTSRLDDEIAKAEEISPEFAKSLQAKRTKELNRVAYVLSQPLKEQDIVRAMQNYKSKVPQFDPKNERISQQDMEGIAKEINAVLAQKGTNIQMSEEFLHKVEKELADTQKRMIEKENSINAQAEARRSVGSDVTAKGEQQSAKETTKSLKEKVKDIKAKDINNPYAADNPNAPKQNREGKGTNESGSSVERLVKNIRNASRGVSSKKMTGVNPRAIEFSKRLENLERLSEQAASITGEELYNIDDVLKRLETL